MSRSVIKILLSVVVLSTIASLVPAEDVEKKWRVSLGAGGYNPHDEVDSNAANFLVLRDEEFDPLFLFEDPRSDSTVFGNLDVQSGFASTVAVQFAVTKIFLVEGSIGYGKNDLGDVAVDVQFLADPPPIPEISYNFTPFRVSTGEIERMPVQLTGIFRFRPRAKFNPFVGLGMGYSVNGYETTEAFNDLSRNMDASTGQPQKITSSLTTDGSLLAFGDAVDLQGAEVDVRDSFEWHLVAGAEVTFKRKWSVFGDLRWTDHSRDIQVRFNGDNELGRSVPQFEEFVASDLGNEFILGRGGGPVLISTGGLIDGGQLVNVPRVGIGADVVCPDEPIPNDPLCEVLWFSKDPGDPDLNYASDRLPDDFEPNGELDSGFYYVQGGKVSYDGYTLVFGVRYTF